MSLPVLTPAISTLRSTSVCAMTSSDTHVASVTSVVKVTSSDLRQLCSSSARGLLKYGGLREWLYRRMGVLVWSTSVLLVGVLSRVGVESKWEGSVLVSAAARRVGVEWACSEPVGGGAGEEESLRSATWKEVEWNGSLGHWKSKTL